MGVDHSASLVIGFVVDPREFLKKLEKKRKEVSTTKKRWDPNTGKRLPDEKVVTTPAGTDFCIPSFDMVFKGMDDDADDNSIYDDDKLREAIEVLADCWIFECGNGYCGEWSWAISVARKITKKNQRTDDKDAISLAEIPEMHKRLERVREILLANKFTLKDKVPRAIAVLTTY